jgi:GntR family transcriptional regulator / MocR family aminotransferase
MDIPLGLDTTSSTPLYRQLYDSLKTGIVAGRFAPGSRLPASRSLARSVGVSRITVTECFERLISEGYLEAKRGSGTFVCQELPESGLAVSPSAKTASISSAKEVSPRLSQYGTAVDVSMRRTTPREAILLDRHGPDVSQFPRKVWARLVARRMQESDQAMFDYSLDIRGYPDLRTLTARYLAQARAVICEPDQILIVSGSQQAIYLAARILLDQGDQVAMESPGYYYAGTTFSAQGAQIIPVAVDKHGIKVAELHQHKDIRMVYVTPSHQFPTGAALSLTRRNALLAWARKNKAFILEDDYDSEFRFRESPLPALQGISPSAPVIYTGSFSKLLFPSLRLGYLVLPKTLTTAFRTAKLLSDVESSPFHQLVLTDFLAKGHLESHLRRMRTLYAKRRSILIGVLQHHFGKAVKISGDDAGMYLLANFRTHLSEQDAWNRACAAGVRMEQLFWPDGVCKTPPGWVQFVFAYASRSEKELHLAGQRLATALLS